VPEQLHYSPRVAAVLQQVRRERASRGEVVLDVRSLPEARTDLVPVDRRRIGGGSAAYQLLTGAMRDPVV
jgi:hypothetical protein